MPFHPPPELPQQALVSRMGCPISPPPVAARRGCHPDSYHHLPASPIAGHGAPLREILATLVPQLPAVIADNTVIFSITDGGLGDDDLTANGTIVDPGGPNVGGTSSAYPDAIWVCVAGAAGLMELFLDGEPRVVLGADDLDGSEQGKVRRCNGTTVRIYYGQPTSIDCRSHRFRNSKQCGEFEHFVPYNGKSALAVK